MILTLSDLRGLCRQTECSQTSHPNSNACTGCRFWQQYLYDCHEEQHACIPYIFARNGRTLSLEGDYNTVLAQAAKQGFSVFDLTNY